MSDIKHADAKTILLRLRRRIRRDCTHYNRIWEDTKSNLSKERAWGEIGVCQLVLGYINNELEKL